jgi:hypothetical protein
MKILAGKVESFCEVRNFAPARTLFVYTGSGLGPQAELATICTMHSYRHAPVMHPIDTGSQ